MNEKNKRKPHHFSETYQGFYPHQGNLYATDEYVEWLLNNRGVKEKSARQYPTRVLDAAYFGWRDGCGPISLLEEVWEAYEDIGERSLAEAVADQHRAYSQLKEQIEVVRWSGEKSKTNDNNRLDKDDITYKKSQDQASALNRYCDFLKFKTHKMICEELHIDTDKRDGDCSSITAFASAVHEVMKSIYYLPYSDGEVEAIHKLLHNLSTDYDKKPIARYEEEFKDYLVRTYNLSYSEKYLTKFRNINTKFLHRVYSNGSPLRKEIPLPDTPEGLNTLQDSILNLINQEKEHLQEGKASFADFNRKEDFTEGEKAIKFYFNFIKRMSNN